MFDRLAFMNRAKKLQMDSGLSMNKFAKTTGISTPPWQGYARGDATPTIEVADVIVRALHINMMWFIYGKGPKDNDGTGSG
jgi:transcriptional regulator with XRE-family HTH domain